MKVSKAIRTTLEDWLRRDRAMTRLSWLIGTLLLAPTVPLIALVRIRFKEPERNPDFGKDRRDA